jgi:hypothetical protein
LNPVEIGPAPEAERTQSPLDLFLIWAGADIVATTFVVGASLAGSFDTFTALLLIGVGSLAGAAMVASLAPARPAPGRAVDRGRARGARHPRRGPDRVPDVRDQLRVVAINNVIAASVCAGFWGGPATERAWAVGLGLLSTLVVAGGPRWVARTDRLAVPLLFGLSGRDDGRVPAARAGPLPQPTRLAAHAAARAGRGVRLPGLWI